MNENGIETPIFKEIMIDDMTESTQIQEQPPRILNLDKHKSKNLEILNGFDNSNGAITIENESGMD